MQVMFQEKSGAPHASGTWRKARATFAVLLMLMASGICARTGWAHEFSAGSLVIDHPWSRATPPGAKVGGAYFTVTNNGKEPDQLIAATAEPAERAEFHRMSITGDVMTMAKLDKPVSIDPGQTVNFEPGGQHVMLFGLQQPLKEGEKFSGTLTFEKAGTVEISFEIDKLGVRVPSISASEDAEHSKMQQN